MDTQNVRALMAALSLNERSITTLAVQDVLDIVARAMAVAVPEHLQNDIQRVAEGRDPTQYDIQRVYVDYILRRIIFHLRSTGERTATTLDVNAALYDDSFFSRFLMEVVPPLPPWPPVRPVRVVVDRSSSGIYDRIRGNMRDATRALDKIRKMA